jgi:hypothetical protein
VGCLAVNFANGLGDARRLRSTTHRAMAIGKQNPNLQDAEEEILRRNKGLLPEFIGLENAISKEVLMRSLGKPSLGGEENDLRDWYVIGGVAVVSSLMMWLLLFFKVSF